MRKFGYILFLAFVLLGCNNESNNNTDNSEFKTEDINAESEPEMDNSALKEVENILTTIPSSHEITSTIKASGAPYSSLVLSNPHYAEQYTTNYRKAINLGIYGTDLGYIGIYDQADVLTDHIQVINKLASDMDLSHLLRTATIKKMIDEGNLSDSVFTISAEVFQDMCIYLQSNERHEVGVLMLLGGWLEAIHIATTVCYNSQIDNPNLNNKIAEQKIVLNKFISALNLYSDEPFFKHLLLQLNELKKLYNEIQFDQSNNKSNETADSANVMVPTSSANITDVQLAQITIALEKIRKSIVNPQ